ncbi:tumor necrosis factor receptor superfamily member 27 isoform X2 [Anas acuta]|uniref:tumor necrosis factor receptor superfamily member 27 isoform X2 n=1 Tax=Anas acuta TaxID=28680 RepID=UPI0035C8FB2D
MDCKESEDPYEHSKCTPCRNCMPGQELSKECGDGTGGDAQCVPCPPRKFKDSWGHHSCKPCLSCALINRIQKSNCTATTNAVCGECLPGFYRKARISGQLGWECIPCTKQTPSSEPQCRSRTSLVKVAVPTVPPQDTALLALTSSALVIIVLVLLALSIIYCKRFWKSQCQRGPVEAVQFISEGEAISLQLPPTQPELELPSAVAVSPASKGQLVRSVLESQPLVRSSGCSDRLATALAPSDLRPGQRGVPEALAPLSSCASEMQHKWPHAPVECTELDLQKFSSQVEFVGSERSEEVGSQATRGVPREGGSAALEAGSSLVVDPARGLSPTVQNPTAESGEQPVNDAQSLVTQISNTMKGLPVSELPHSLVQSLAFLLDPSLNGVKNFSHVALELGVAPQFLGRISGFEQLITHLTYSGDSVTIPHLAQALQRLQRFDALLLLCDHFALSQIQGHQC